MPAASSFALTSTAFRRSDRKRSFRRCRGLDQMDVVFEKSSICSSKFADILNPQRALNLNVAIYCRRESRSFIVVLRVTRGFNSYTSITVSKEKCIPAREISRFHQLWQRDVQLFHSTTVTPYRPLRWPARTMRRGNPFSDNSTAPTGARRSLSVDDRQDLICGDVRLVEVFIDHEPRVVARLSANFQLRLEGARHGNAVLALIFPIPFLVGFPRSASSLKIADVRGVFT